MEQADLEDVWRTRNPNSKTYSWVHKKSQSSTEMSGSQIDLALISSSLMNNVIETKYSYGFKTDHSLFHLKLKAHEVVRGPGYWKLNKRLLHDHDFVKEANAIIDQANKKCGLTKADALWENCRSDVAVNAKRISKLKAKERKERLNELIHMHDEAKLQATRNCHIAQERCKKYETEINQLI